MSAFPHHTSDQVCALCEQKLSMAHPDLQSWFRIHIKPHFPQAHVSWSYRDALSQQQAFDEGKTKLLFPNSAHNRTPAMALDLFEINDQGQAIWDPKFFASIVGYNSDNNISLKWGGSWRDLGDNDHFQLP